jgi:hypothetical protein
MNCEVLLDAQLTQLLDASQDLCGLKTVTQRDLIEIVELNYEKQQNMKIESRKVLGWGSDSSDQNEPN